MIEFNEETFLSDYGELVVQVRVPLEEPPETKTISVGILWRGRAYMAILAFKPARVLDVFRGSYPLDKRLPETKEMFDKLLEFAVALEPNLFPEG